MKARFSALIVKFIKELVECKEIIDVKVIGILVVRGELF
jgi:hypothetical protein